MKIEKVSANGYRIRKKYKGKMYQINLPYCPTQKEATILMADLMQNEPEKGVARSFKTATEDYIALKLNVLSPATVRGYKGINKKLEDKYNWFSAMDLFDIDQNSIQRVVNEMAAVNSPKSVRNAYGLISAVLGTYRPTMRYSCTLPQKRVYEAVMPTIEDVKKVINHLKGTEYGIFIQLCALGLRREEALAVTKDDLDSNNILTINKAKVPGEDGKLVEKTTKTVGSNRKIYVPESLAAEIRAAENIYTLYPNSALRALHRAQDELGVPRFRLHDLRHMYASYAHSQGVPEADILKAGGWSTDYTMKSIYRHSLDVENSNQKKVAEMILD